MKVLFTSTHLASFIREDLDLLRRHFDVEYRETVGVRAFFGIARAVRNVDVTFTWFASVYAFATVLFAKMLKKRSVVVVGGVDVAKHPEIGYGIWLSPWKALLVKYGLRRADAVLVVDPSQRREAMKLARYDGVNIRYVPTGFSAEQWYPSGGKEPIVLTVAKCEDMTRVKVKGLPFLMNTARRLPNLKFVIIGPADHIARELQAVAPSNVEVLPFVEQDELRSYYQRAKVYCQPSYSEGLPNSVCEAMLCECIPVGTNVGGMSTAMGDSGFLVPFGDGQALADAIIKALTLPQSVGEAGRKHIAENFTLHRREQEIMSVIRELTRR